MRKLNDRKIYLICPFGCISVHLVVTDNSKCYLGDLATVIETKENAV